MKVAIIVGCLGQDGTYLSELLLDKGYLVHGIIKPKKLNDIINQKLVLHYIDISQYNDLENLIIKIKPSEVYYLATTHEHSMNLNTFNNVMEVNVTGVVNLLEIIRINNLSTRFFYASSSNVFAGSSESPQNEKTTVSPKTLYGIAKNTSMQFLDFYREEYNIFTCYGVLYNHESVRRKINFVTMKIINAAINIKNGSKKKLYLGNLDDVRDWGCAKDFVQAMWLMLQAPKPQNYIIGTGEALSVKDVLRHSFDYLGMNWERHVEIDQSLFRNKLKFPLIADYTRIKNELGWSPSRDFLTVIEEIIDEIILSRKTIK